MNLIRYAAIVAVSAVSLLASDDALQSFHAKYRGLNTVSFAFKGQQGLSGSILAKRGGSYRITSVDRTVVSDGKTVWNATSSTKTVIVSDYKPTSTDVSIERVFFEVMSVYRSSITSKSSGGVVVRLDAPSTQTQIAGISSVELSCTASFMVKGVKIVSNGSVSEFSISKFVANRSTKPSEFRFAVPDDWQMMDIR
jgi:outer membrane lipoprotein-sorting protein